MVRRAEGVEIALTVNSKNAKRGIKDFEGYWEKSIIKIGDFVKKSKILGPLAGGAIGGMMAISGGIEDPTRSLAGQTGNIVGDIVKGVTTAMGFATGGPAGALVGFAAGESISKLVKRKASKDDFVENTSVSQVQSIFSNFARVGLKPSDSDVEKLLNLFRQINKRTFDSMTQVAKVSEETSKTIGGIIGKTARRTLGNVK